MENLIRALIKLKILNFKKDEKKNVKKLNYEKIFLQEPG